MPSNLNPSPKVDVRYWNARNVYVECPYCEEIHHHGPELPGHRTSHCYPGGQYEFIFPIDYDSKLVGYEIDKKWACFVNVGLRTTQGDAHSDSLEAHECDLSDQFHHAVTISPTKQTSGSNLSLYDDSRELEIFNLSDDDTWEQKSIIGAIAECVFGNLAAIRKYFHTSAEKELFLHGKDESGDTTLILAAAEKSHEMVSLLLQHGADANAVNNNGRSALMQAALWGRIKSVRALLDANADKTLRDRQGRRAIDLAQPARRNEKERYGRSRLAAADSLPERDRDRRHIVLLLGDPVATKQQRYTAPLSESERNKYEFRKSQTEMAITLHGPIRSYRVPRITKTAAVLDRGDPFTQISATSGWGVDALPLNRENRPDWIEQVSYIAAIIGHKVQNAPCPGWDRGKAGQYFASHAEKKLIAYFIDRHVFLPQDREPDQALENSISEKEDILAEGEQSSAAWAKVRDLGKSRAELDRQLFDADDRLLGDSYDEEKVGKLKHEIHMIDEELSSLESHPSVVEMRAEEKKLSRLFKRDKRHEKLMELSENEPLISLKRAVILSSNEICDDCDNFKQRVNEHFQLNIEMNWCT